MSYADPSKREITAALFFWGNPVLLGVAFCMDSRPQTFGVVTYEPVPRMEATVPQNREGEQSDPATISFDMSRISHLSAPAQEFLTKMYGEDPVHRTYCKIITAHVSEAGISSVRTIHYGEVSLRKSDDPPGRLELEISNPKASEQVSSGFTIDVKCNNSLGDERCQIDLDTIRQVGTASYLGDFRMEVLGLTNPPSNPTYWLEGYAEKNGLYLPIKDWNSAEPTVFILSRKMPSDWEGQTVRMIPGCLLDEAACTRWNNVRNMNILGNSTRATHPVFEAD